MTPGHEKPRNKGAVSERQQLRATKPDPTFFAGQVYDAPGRRHLQQEGRMRVIALIFWLALILPVAARPGVAESSPGPFSDLSLACTESDSMSGGVCAGEFFLVHYRVAPAISWLNDEELVARIRTVIDEESGIPPDDAALIADFFPKFMSPYDGSEILIIQAYMAAVDPWR